MASSLPLLGHDAVIVLRHREAARAAVAIQETATRAMSLPNVLLDCIVGFRLLAKTPFSASPPTSHLSWGPGRGWPSVCYRLQCRHLRMGLLRRCQRAIEILRNRLRELVHAGGEEMIGPRHRPILDADVLLVGKLVHQLGNSLDRNQFVALAVND